MVDTKIHRDEMSFLVAITGNMAKICAQSLHELNLPDSDLGIATLIIKYAQEIDKGNLATLAKVGPLILQAMESLQMSPRARALAAKGNNSNGVTITKPVNKLDEIRAQRDKRKNGTTDLHSTTA